MSDKPDISVVMGVYNGADLLPPTIESVLNQTYGNFEFIIVDDGSSDGASGVLEAYARKDKRIRILSQENAGLTKALIRGCEEAKGKYIARQDCGDISLPERFRLQKEALDQDSGIAFVSCWTEWYGPEGETLCLIKGTGKAAVPISIFPEGQRDVLDGPTCHSSVMFRKDAYVKAGGYRKEFYYTQDWDLWLRLAGTGKFQILPKVLQRFLLTQGGLSGRHGREQRILRELIIASARKRAKGLSDKDELEKAGALRPVKKRSRPRSRWQDAEWLYFIGEILRKNGDGKALNYFKRSLKVCPLYWKAYARIAQMYCAGKMRA
jgi:glycosyltransferase involved in cell wall biosynthesis